MRKIEAIDRVLKMIWEWQDKHEYCLQLSKSYPELKKEYDESIETVMRLEEIKSFLETQ